MCEDCSSSQSSQSRSDRQIAFFSIVNDMGVISKDESSKIQTSEKDLRCSCCGVSLDRGFYSPYLVFKPSWGVLDYSQKGNLIKEKGEDDESYNGFIGGGYSDPSRSDCPTDHEVDDSGNRDGVVKENQMLSDASVDKALERSEEDAEEEDDGRLDCPATRFRFEETEGEDEIGSMESEHPLVEYDSRISIESNATLLHSSEENDILIKRCCEDDAFSKIFIPCFGKFSNGDRLIPIDLIDSVTLKNMGSLNSTKDEEHANCGGQMENELQSQKHVASVVNTERVTEEERILPNEMEVNRRSEMHESVAEGENSCMLPAEEVNRNLVHEVCSHVAIAQATQTMPIDTEGDNTQVVEKDSDEHPVPEESSNIIDTEGKFGRLTEREICNNDQMDQPQIHDQISSLAYSFNYQFSASYNDAHDSTACDELVADEEQVAEHTKELIQEGGDCHSTSQAISGIESFKKIEEVGDCCLSSQPVTEIESVEIDGKTINHHLSTSSDMNDMDEEKPPETPTFYMDTILNLHKRLLFERKESGTESLDGSVISEIEGGEVLTIDRLKAALRSEHKALSALYAELEEERSASAIAANQTMAMITRLQEEKAAMQMEALQYQRMMEEQSEYDQEALQLLNELMVKREKEKQELEKELDLYRKKVLFYEAKEKRIVSKEKGKRSNGISSPSSSAEDSDELSVDLNEGEDGFFVMQESTQNTPADDVMTIGIGHESMKHLSTLDESLADFEEERLSILEQLKALEEKLFTLTDEEEHFEDIKSIEHYLGEDENVGTENHEFCSHHVNGVANGFCEELGTNGMHYHERRNMGSKAKTLLPLFDAIGLENEDGLHEEQDPTVVSQKSICKFMPENRKVAIEEEVDHVYERLQALEADREFLKHCISSLKKGDKGMDLLQEILQHLRDLRSVELRVRNTGDTLS